MGSRSKVIWTLKELTICLRNRQLNQFDVNIGVSGKRGNGKSTILFKIFNAYKKLGFNQEKQQVYSRKDVVSLLANQKFGYCWDDEAINSGYKRDFQNRGQKELIKIITNYRDSFNIYASAIPFFYSLDKDLRELIFLHIHIIERGLAVLLMPVETSIHTQDPWDTKTNVKIELQENKRLEKEPEANFRYHRFTTFAGYLYFGDMTPKQRRKYLEIKKRKRALSLDVENGVQDKIPFNQRIYKALKEERLTKETFTEICLLEGKKYSAVATMMNSMLNDEGESKTMTQFFKGNKKKDYHNKNKDQINDLLEGL